MRMITRYFTYLKKHFTNLKLRNKFLIGYVILLILPLLITGTLFYNWFAKVTIKQTKEISIQSVKQAELNISYIKEQVENLGDMVFWDMEFRELLKQKDTLLYDQVEEYEKIINMITNMEESPKIHRIRLYVLDNKLYARNNQTIFPLSMLEDNKYFQSMER